MKQAVSGDNAYSDLTDFEVNDHRFLDFVIRKEIFDASCKSRVDT